MNSPHITTIKSPHVDIMNEGDWVTAGTRHTSLHKITNYNQRICEHSLKLIQLSHVVLGADDLKLCILKNLVFRGCCESAIVMCVSEVIN